MTLLAAYQVACAAGGSGGTLKSAYATACVGGGPSGPVDPFFANVVLLAPFSTVINDDASNSNHTLTAVDNAQILNGSLELDGTLDTVTIPDSPDWDLGSGDFTLEVWAERDVNNPAETIISTTTGAASGGWYFEVGAQSGRQLVFAANGALILKNGGNPLAPGTRRHVAICRDGTTLRGFRDGVLWNSAAVGTTVFNVSDTDGLVIGANTNGSSVFNGRMGNLRITKGVARYTAAFTPPTEPFPTQ